MKNSLFFLSILLKKTIIEWKKHCKYIQSKYSGSAVKQCHCVNCTSATVLKCDDSNSTLAVRLGFDLHRFLQVLSFFGKEKKIEKNLARTRLRTWFQLIRSRSS